MPSASLIQVSLRDKQETVAAQARLGELLGDAAQVVTDGSEPATIRLVSLEDLPRDPAGSTVVGVGETALPALVQLLRDNPWLDHVVSPKVISSDAALVMAGALRHLLDGSDEGDPLAGGHTSTIADSELRQAPLDAICAEARAGGASPLAAERIRDVAEETITNALYNAPAEANRPTKIRSERVQLELDLACKVSYRVAGKLFLLRVSDGFGSLKRDRMCEVLDRCARQQGVSLDTSRGGAGLGMWRVFNAATVIVIRVFPGQRTEITMALELHRRTNGSTRAVHLFFDEKRPA